MIKEAKEHLYQVIIPFWKGMRDDDYGGFYGYMDYNLKLHKEAVKGSILNSRILWFFSSASITLEDDTLLKEADHAYRFLVQHCMDQENGGVHWALQYNATPYDTTKHTYNQAFAIYALSTYYQATHNPEALDKAMELFDLIETKCRDEIGYMEAFDQQFHEIGNDKLSENGVIAQKTMNTLLHILEAYTQLYYVTKNERVAGCLRWIFDKIADQVYNPVLHRQEVFFDKDMNSIIDLYSYGHDIEASWLIDRGLEILGDAKYINKMQPITDDLRSNTYKTAFNGKVFYNECENGVVDKKRIWWVQAEALVGFLNGYQASPKKQDYLVAVKLLWNYIQDYLVDKRQGSEWYWALSENDQPIVGKPIVEPWKCPYHNGRMCLEIIRRGIDVA